MLARWVVGLAVVGVCAMARPATLAAQSTATAPQVTCADGTTSKAGQGACSHHGGIKTATTGAAGGMTAASTPGGGRVPNKTTVTPSAAGTPTPAPATTGTAKPGPADSTGAIAQCTDGIFWHGTVRQGACSGHRGVKRWLAAAPAK